MCERDRAIVFVEVKARRSARFGSAAETVSFRKRRRIGAIALDYLSWTGRLDAPCRFMVVAIDGIGTPREAVRIIDDAFGV